jgi:hypothetical protein
MRSSCDREVQGQIGHAAGYISPAIQDGGLSHRIRALEGNQRRELLAHRAIRLSEISIQHLSFVVHLNTRMAAVSAARALSKVSRIFLWSGSMRDSVTGIGQQAYR